MRLNVRKTYKLYINGEFPRTESGRFYAIKGKGGELLANACRGSRKDLRNAVQAARKAFPGWSGKTAFNRGQILYRAAENVKRVVRWSGDWTDSRNAQSPYAIFDFQEMKTVWHPMGM